METEKQAKDNQMRCNAIKGAMAQLADTDMFDSVQILATYLEEGQDVPRFYESGFGNLFIRRESAVIWSDVCLMPDEDIEFELEFEDGEEEI